MSRRTLTLLLASLLALGLTGAAVATPVPYVALVPGPTYNTLAAIDGEQVIAITGREVFPTDGHLDLTTVGVQNQLTLFEALQGWFSRDEAVVPRDVVYPPDKTTDQVNAENAESMVRSQNSAVTAAARELGFETVEVSVAEIGEGSPSQGRLKVGDVLRTVGGEPVLDEAGLIAAVRSAGVGAAVKIGYVRAGVDGVATITTAAATDDATRAIIGIQPAEKALDLPFKVDITLEQVGGPSAGLMFALGILDKLDRASLTGGEFIAGTGEISANGAVGPIGGITQKLIASRRKGAVVFLVPAANCAEALRRPPAGLILAEVATLDDALAALEAVRAGRQPELCG